MDDIIQLLPDSVANQIAAGEVIQRPASVVKELVENAVDAGSTSIIIKIKDSGRTLIQIIDNGCGMTMTDTRMSFERHATSKIRKTDDLLSIRTKGFRGEALASIAAISSVELKTKRVNDELGTRLCIEGSQVTEQERVAVPNGSNFNVKNIFYNVPARRKFLKSNPAELRQIIDEVLRVAYTHPDIAFKLISNDTEIYNLPISNLRQRVLNIIGKNRDQQFIPLNTVTSVVTIEGFLGKPEFARKRSGEQFLFVNQRYIKHPYFYKALMKGFEKILPSDMFPSFFLYLTVETETIDVNIHPAKTEVKFENEQTIWHILYASVREALGKFNIVPSLDFDKEQGIQIPVYSKGRTTENPNIAIDYSYNPFDVKKRDESPKYAATYKQDKPVPGNWEKLYEGLTDEDSREHCRTNYNSVDAETETNPQLSFSGQPERSSVFFQFKKKFILTPVKSGLMVINQKKAHERILYEKYLISLSNKIAVAQKTLFPQSFEFGDSDFELIMEMRDDLRVVGFEVEEFGKRAVVVNAVPGDMTNCNLPLIFDQLLESFRDGKKNSGENANEKLAAALAKSSSISGSTVLSIGEMNEMVDQLFACTSPNYGPDGSPVIAIISDDEIEKKFK